MGLTKERYEQSEAEKYGALVSKILDALIDPNNAGQVSSLNLRTLVAAILNIAVSPASDSAPSQTVPKLAPFGSLTDSGRLLMRAEDVEKVHATFQLLYLTRKTYHLASPPRLRRTETAVVGMSRQTPLARRHASLVDLADELIQSRQLQLTYGFCFSKNWCRKIGKMQSNREAEQKQACTFVPKITAYTPKADDAKKRKEQNATVLFSVYNRSPAAEKCQELYQMAAKRRNQQRLQRKCANPDEKMLAECTFKPNLVKDAKAVHVSDADDPLIEKTVERMRKGRAERDRARKMLERSADLDSMRFDVNRNKHSNGTFDQFCAGRKGISPVQRNKRLGGHRRMATADQETIVAVPNKLDDVKSASKRVILNIEVNMGESQERIVVHEGDTPAKLAYEFSLSHRMD